MGGGAAHVGAPILQAIDCGSELMSQRRVFLIVSGTRTVSADQAIIL